ncbi:hypothetical protein RDI58_029607 [Solanum bulbocastanum]|uniref:Uncharacterized protein n=1 Tax=Solanum bulbocastanum TaxID=147425 RepID=A0AAN8SXW1_SOLBU
MELCTQTVAADHEVIITRRYGDPTQDLIPTST